MNVVDNKYQRLVNGVLNNGNYKENRTGVDTISDFGVSYSMDNSRGFPLLTTKKMDGGRWETIVRELLWYLSGEEHIRNLREHTGVWDDWGDENGNLDSAYGRFWRKYPSPEYGKEGEKWASDVEDYITTNKNGRDEMDQIQYVIDNLKENPNSRRHVVTAWHPANAAVSTLPPCHFTFVFNVQNGDELNLHLTQRSGDLALGVPFNIAAYALLQKIIAQEVDMEVGEFHHTIVDAHIYCGEGERGKWWKENIDELPDHYSHQDVADITEWVEDEAPDNPDNLDHIPGLLKQFTRAGHDVPRVEIADKPIDDLEYEDFELLEYEGHESIKFEVAV